MIAGRGDDEMMMTMSLYKHNPGLNKNEEGKIGRQKVPSYFTQLCVVVEGSSKLKCTKN